ncbi:MAG: chorismate mutase [Syntrophobacteraceae bacterium]|jgi:hypothetical protein|nr:chorismate mutase [Syntrophobacteraceae bacterium]
MFPRRWLPVTVALAAFIGACCAVGIPGSLAAEETSAVASEGSMEPGSPASDPAVDCRELLRLLEQQRAQLARELGQIKREMGLLREELGKPGLKEVFAGIGYILGLAGIGLYVHSRRRSGPH